MTNNMTTIEKCAACGLFRGMDPEEIASALARFHARVAQYDKSAVILHAGDRTKSLALVLEGSVTIQSDDLWGNRTILTMIGTGGLFAETYALLHETLLVDAVANTRSEILFLDITHLREISETETPWSAKFLSRLLTIAAKKNLTLASRSFDTAAKTIRGRVMSYLNSIALKEHARSFEIPFDRQQLADYLNVERTALSKELGKMQREGLVDFRKNHFEILGTSA